MKKTALLMMLSCTSLHAAVSNPPAIATQQLPINCQYRIPADIAHIEQSVVLTWAKKAVEQSFNLSHMTIDSQLTALKDCFTEQGWQGFNDALQKSGNIDAIKSQKLTSQSHIDGEIKITDSKENQWKLTIPMQVIYQNDKEKLPQLLSIDLLIGRKVSGDLGIMQMVARPRQPESTTVTQPPQS